MNIANQFAKCFGTALLSFLIFGFLLPFLFSASSWISVGLGVTILFLTIYFMLLIVQRIVKKQVKKTIKENKE